LVYDECPDNAESLVQLLACHGHRVRTAVQPGEAVAAAAADPPDVFITEIGPAHSSRFGLAGRVTRACPAHPLLIALTGWPLSWCDSEDVAFDHRFVKAEDPNALLAVVNSSPHRWDRATPRHGEMLTRKANAPRAKDAGQ
jgi:DNA-binding NtrC family response regulator